jgi:membrane protease YdiL (CAAX protease family)
MRIAKTEASEKNKAPGIYKVLGAFFLDIGLLCLFWFAGMLLSTALWTLATHYGNGGALPSSEPGAMATMLMGLSSFYVSIFVVSAVRNNRLTVQQGTASNFSRAALAIFGGLTLCILTMSILYALRHLGLELKPGNQALLEDAGKNIPVLAGIFVVLIAPVFEELFFRKQIFARFQAAGFPVTGYILSSLLFAMMHEPLPTQGLPEWCVMLLLYGLIGASFAWVYQKTGKLWPAILAHASNNLCAIGILFLV